MIEAFAEWAASVAALATAKDRLQAARVNELCTSRAMMLWNKHGHLFEMRKPEKWIHE